MCHKNVTCSMCRASPLRANAMLCKRLVMVMCGDFQMTGGLNTRLRGDHGLVKPSLDIVPQIILPGSRLEVAQDVSRAAVHDFFQCQTAEMHCQAEWMLMQCSSFQWAFLSHRILEERENADFGNVPSENVSAEGEGRR